MSRQSLWVRVSERFREVRRLALPTVAGFIVGSLGAWLGRHALLVWLFDQLGGRRSELSLAPGVPPIPLESAPVDLALVVGLLLVVPLVIWQAAAVVMPAAIQAARHRFAAYQALSFVVVGFNLLHDISRRAEETRAWRAFDLEFGPEPGRGDWPASMWDSVQFEVKQLVPTAILAAIVVPIYVAVRHHSASAHPARATAIAAWCVGALVMIVLRTLDDTHPVRVSVRGFVVTGAILGVLIPLLSSALYRALTEKEVGVLQVLGWIGLLLAFGALMFVANDEGLWFFPQYPAAAGSALVARGFRRESCTP